MDDQQSGRRLWVDLLGNPELEMKFNVQARYANQVIQLKIQWSEDAEGFRVLASDPPKALRYWLAYPAALDVETPFLPQD